MLVSKRMLVHTDLTMKKEHSNHIDRETKDSNNENVGWFMKMFGLDETFNAFKKDGETKSQKEDTIDESSKNLGTDPSKSVRFGFSVGYLKYVLC